MITGHDNEGTHFFLGTFWKMRQNAPILRGTTKNKASWQRVGGLTKFLLDLTQG